MKRRAMSRSASRGSFSRHSGHHPKNNPKIMRGGYRL
nr:MAG: hypothetical protein [Microvirus sp.]